MTAVEKVAGDVRRIRRFDGPWPDLSVARDVNIASVVTRAARSRGDHEALVYQDQRFTYRELDAAIDRVAFQLHDMGVYDGHFVITLARNSANVVVLYLALARLGAVNVPLNPMLTATEILELVERTQPALIVHTAEFNETAAALEHSGYRVVDMPEGGDGLGEDHWFRMTPAPAVPFDPAPGGARPACVVFTSGSTSKPKGCVKTHANFMWHSMNMHLGWKRSQDDIEYFCIPLSGIGFPNFVLTIFSAMGTLVVDRVSARNSAATMERERVTTTFLPATAAQTILLDDGAKGRDLSSLRTVHLSYRMTPEFRVALVEQYGPIFNNGYGSTEGAMICGTADSFLANATSHGVPRGVDEIVIGNPDGTIAPVGERGEILLKGPCVMAGYLDDPAATAETLRDGWLHTGDIGHFDERGELHFDGRLKDIIKTGGYNVSSEEVEAAIVSLPGVADAAVFGVADARWGEAVRAVVVLSPGAGWTEATLGTELRRTLAAFKCPKSILFADDLPRNPGGKLVKAAIVESYGGIV